MTEQQIDTAIVRMLAGRSAYLDEICSALDENSTIVRARLRALRDAGQVVLIANGVGGRRWAVPVNKFNAPIVKTPKTAKPTSDRSWWLDASADNFSARAAGQFGKK